MSKNETGEVTTAKKVQNRNLIAVLVIKDGKPTVAVGDDGKQLVAPPSKAFLMLNAVTTIKARGEEAEVVQILYEPDARG